VVDGGEPGVDSRDEGKHTGVPSVFGPRPQLLQRAAIFMKQ